MCDDEMKGEKMILSDMDVGHEFRYPLSGELLHAVITTADVQGHISVALERAAHGPGIAVRDTQVNDRLARREDFGSHIEIQQMGIGVLHGATDAGSAVISSHACDRKLAALLKRREKALFRMERRVRDRRFRRFFFKQYVIF